MNFSQQITALTGLDITTETSPSADEVTQFIRDGARECANRLVLLRPELTSLFCIDEYMSEDRKEVQSGIVLSVMRENGTSNTFRPATRISNEYQSLATDPESLHFRSKENPAWYMIRDDLYIVPIPAEEDGERAKIEYVAYNWNIELSNVSGIDSFPVQFEYLPVMYSAIKQLQHTLADKKDPLLAATADYLESQELTEYPVGTSDHGYGKMWKKLQAMIEDDEDTELAGTQIQKIATYISAYQAQLQGNATDYEWMVARLQLLQNQYDQAFGLIGQKKQQEQRES